MIDSVFKQLVMSKKCLFIFKELIYLPFRILFRSFTDNFGSDNGKTNVTAGMKISDIEKI